MEGLFSPAEREWQKMEHRDPVGTADLLKWVTGNAGVVRDLRAGKIVAVPAELVHGLSVPKDMEHLVWGKMLSLFTTVLSDDEAMKRFPVAKENVPRLRPYYAARGVSVTAPIVRLIDPAVHLQYCMWVAANVCGPCAHESAWRRGEEGYDGLITEYDGRSPILIFGAPALSCCGNEEYNSGGGHPRHKEVFDKLKQELGVSFGFVRGSAALASLLAHSHFHETSGQRLPQQIVQCAETDSGSLLVWKHEGLQYAANFYTDCHNNNRIGCFALGIVKLDK